MSLCHSFAPRLAAKQIIHVRRKIYPELSWACLPSLFRDTAQLASGYCWSQWAYIGYIDLLHTCYTYCRMSLSLSAYMFEYNFQTSLTENRKLNSTIKHFVVGFFHYPIHNALITECPYHSICLYGGILLNKISMKIIPSYVKINNKN